MDRLARLLESAVRELKARLGLTRPEPAVVTIPVERRPQPPRRG